MLTFKGQSSPRNNASNTQRHCWGSWILFHPGLIFSQRILRTTYSGLSLLIGTMPDIEMSHFAKTPPKRDYLHPFHQQITIEPH